MSICRASARRTRLRASHYAVPSRRVAAMAIGYITVAVWLLILLGVVGGCAALMGLAR